MIRHVKLLTLDGDNPEGWVPFFYSAQSLSHINGKITTWSESVPVLDIPIKLSLALYPRKSLSNQSFAGVFGLIVDATGHERPEKRLDILQQSERAIRNIIRDNPEAKLFGIGFYALVDEINVRKLWPLDKDMKAFCERLSDEFEVEISHNVVNTYEVFIRHLQFDLGRYVETESTSFVEATKDGS